MAKKSRRKGKERKQREQRTTSQTIVLPTDKEIINAVITGHIEQLKKRLPKGIDFNKMCEETLAKILFSAALSNDDPTLMIKFLLEKGADLNTRDSDGVNPLICLLYNKNHNDKRINLLIYVLLNYKEKIHRITLNDLLYHLFLCPLSAQNKRFKILFNILRQCNADIHFLDNEGNTVLHRVILRQSPEHLQFLIDHCRYELYELEKPNYNRIFPLDLSFTLSMAKQLRALVATSKYIFFCQKLEAFRFDVQIPKKYNKKINFIIEFANNILFFLKETDLLLEMRPDILVSLDTVINEKELSELFKLISDTLSDCKKIDKELGREIAYIYAATLGETIKHLNQVALILDRSQKMDKHLEMIAKTLVKLRKSKFPKKTMKQYQSFVIHSLVLLAKIEIRRGNINAAYARLSAAYNECEQTADFAIDAADRNTFFFIINCLFASLFFQEQQLDLAIDYFDKAVRYSSSFTIKKLHASVVLQWDDSTSVNRINRDLALKNKKTPSLGITCDYFEMLLPIAEKEIELNRYKNGLRMLIKCKEMLSQLLNTNQTNCKTIKIGYEGEHWLAKCRIRLIELCSRDCAELNEDIKNRYNAALEKLVSAYNELIKKLKHLNLSVKVTLRPDNKQLQLSTQEPTLFKKLKDTFRKLGMKSIEIDWQASKIKFSMQDLGPNTLESLVFNICRKVSAEQQRIGEISQIQVSQQILTAPSNKTKNVTQTSSSLQNKILPRKKPVKTTKRKTRHRGNRSRSNEQRRPKQKKQTIHNSRFTCIQEIKKMAPKYQHKKFYPLTIPGMSSKCHFFAVLDMKIISTKIKNTNVIDICQRVLSTGRVGSQNLRWTGKGIFKIRSTSDWRVKGQQENTFNIENERYHIVNFNRPNPHAH